LIACSIFFLQRDVRKPRDDHGSKLLTQFSIFIDYVAQFWSVFIPANITGAEAIQLTLEQIDVVHRMCEKYPETFEMAYTAQQVNYGCVV